MPPSAAVLSTVVGLPFLGAALTPVVYRLVGERTAYFAAAVAAASFGLLATQAGSPGVAAIEWIPALSVSLAFYVDGLSLLIGFLASGVGVLVFLYSAGYMHAEPGKSRYYATMLAFMGAMLGVALAADLIALFLFWELTSVASFLLIGHYRDDDGGYAARKSMLITVAGGLFMLVGFLLLNLVAGDLPGVVSGFRLSGDGSLLANADAVRAALRDAGLFVPVLALVGIGAAAKSAQVPLHVWLPNAMEAPTPVSAFLHSATMVKAGVYLIGRVRPLLVAEEWTLAFVVLGLLTMTVAAILAVGATDIKELLAYSTASHLGLIVAGYGVWTAEGGAALLGAETGAFHVLNHALFKAALFLVAGIVAHEAGTRALDDLGGLARDLPVTAGVTVVAALGMAGVPPFNGFYSKELLFEATYELAAHNGGGLWWLVPAVAVLGSVFTFLYSVRFLMLFFGDRPDGLGHVHTPPLTMLAPPVSLAVLAGVVGIGGVTDTFGVDLGIADLVLPVVESSHVGEASFSYYIPDHITPAVSMSAATIGAGVVAYPFYARLHDGVRAVRSVRPLSPNWYYDGATGTLDRSTAIDAVHNGLLRTYALWLLLSVSALALGGYAAAAVDLPAFGSPGVTPAIAIVLAVAAVGAAAVTRAPSHIAGVLTLSILGFMIAIFYILADAPDLALTQLVVETLVLVIFLLVLDKLPAFYGDLRRSRIVRDGAVSLVVGATVAVTVLLSTAGSPGVPAYLDRSLPEYFLEVGPVPEEHGPVITDFGGGGNIVNVILVDFRAFDTMGEISVVAMAALSVITLIAMRDGGESA